MLETFDANAMAVALNELVSQANEQKAAVALLERGKLMKKKLCYEMALHKNPSLVEAWERLASVGGGMFNNRRYSKEDCVEEITRLRWEKYMAEFNQKKLWAKERLKGRALDPKQAQQNPVALAGLGRLWGQVIDPEEAHLYFLKLLLYLEEKLGQPDVLYTCKDVQEICENIEINMKKNEFEIDVRREQKKELTLKSLDIYPEGPLYFYTGDGKFCTRLLRLSTSRCVEPGSAVIFKVKYNPEEWQKTLGIKPVVQPASGVLGAGCGCIVSIGTPPNLVGVWTLQVQAVLIETGQAEVSLKDWEVFCQNGYTFKNVSCASIIRVEPQIQIAKRCDEEMWVTQLNEPRDFKLIFEAVKTRLWMAQLDGSQNFELIFEAVKAKAPNFHDLEYGPGYTTKKEIFFSTLPSCVLEQGGEFWEKLAEAAAGTNLEGAGRYYARLFFETALERNDNRPTVWKLLGQTGGGVVHNLFNDTVDCYLKAISRSENLGDKEECCDEVVKVAWTLGSSRRFYALCNVIHAEPDHGPALGFLGDMGGTDTMTNEECYKRAARENPASRRLSKWWKALSCEHCGRGFEILKCTSKHEKQHHRENCRPRPCSSCSVRPTCWELGDHALMDCDACGEEVPRCSLASHQANTCKLREVACSACHVRMPWIFLQGHKDYDCAGQEVRCQYCNCIVRSVDQKVHEILLCAAKATCEGCGAAMPRYALASHACPALRSASVPEKAVIREGSCPICLSGDSRRARLRAWTLGECRCQCRYHMRCLMNLFDHGKGDFKCPLCRKSLLGLCIPCKPIPTTLPENFIRTKPSELYFSQPSISHLFKPFFLRVDDYRLIYQSKPEDLSLLLYLQRILATKGDEKQIANMTRRRLECHWVGEKLVAINGSRRLAMLKLAQNVLPHLRVLTYVLTPQTVARRQREGKFDERFDAQAAYPNVKLFRDKDGAVEIRVGNVTNWPGAQRVLRNYREATAAPAIL